MGPDTQAPFSWWQTAIEEKQQNGCYLPPVDLITDFKQHHFVFKAL